MQDSHERTARTWIVGQDQEENEDVQLRRGRGFGADILIVYCFFFKVPALCRDLNSFFKTFFNDYLSSRFSNLVIIRKNVYCDDLRIFVPKIVTHIFKKKVVLMFANPNILGLQTLVLNFIEVPCQTN